MPAAAGAHTWRVFEIFSNADGTIQFVELREMNGGDGETAISSANLVSNAALYDITTDLNGATGFRHLLFATAAFDALPNSPTPDFLIPNNFVNINGDTLRYSPYEAPGQSFGAGQLPTDGVQSLELSLVTGTLVPVTNSPENFAGDIGQVDASPQLPAVPASGTPMTATKLDPAGTALSISWNTAACGGATNHQLIYGERSDLPATPTGSFALAGSVCNLGPVSTFTWDPSPTAADGSGLIWWLMLVVDAGSTKEGPWGRGAAGERVGPGTGGSSGECGVTAKQTGNTCGQ